MSKVAQRLIIFFVGVPLVVALIMFDFQHHLALNVVMTWFFLTAACELWNMFSNKFQLVPKWLIAALTALIPVSAYLSNLFALKNGYIELVFICGVLLILAAEVFTAKTFEASNGKLITGAFILLYCGYMPTYLARMCWLEQPTLKIILFVLLVFISDSIAWVFGMLFGKNNRGIIAASPNKSIAGFIGAYIGDFALVTLFKLFIWPDPSWLVYCVLAFCICTSSIIGDLTESVLKRSCECKDSGNIILGRGGVLDSIDSIIVSAPIFYILITLMF